MRSFRTLILSLAFHILLAWLLTQLPPMDLTPPAKRDTVQWLDTSQLSAAELAAKKARDKQLFEEKAFVRKAPPPPELLTQEEKQARFSSESKQNVIEERKASKSGLTVNRRQDAIRRQSIGERTAQKPRPQGPTQETVAKNSARRPSLELKPKTPLQDAIAKELAESRQPLLGSGAGDVRVGGIQPSTGSRGPTGRAGRGNQDARRNEPVPLELPNFMGAERGESTVGESLPDDIKFGEFTALNADRNLFYSFYSRLEEVIRPPWVRYARAALYAYATGAKRLTGRETWSTKLEVLLDKNGRYLRSVVHEGSGIATLDEAPVEAFRSAQLFPHPPPEMVKADGLIHIYCMFTVSVGSQYADGE